MANDTDGDGKIIFLHEATSQPATGPEMTVMQAAASIAAALAWEAPDIGLLGIKKNADNSVNMAFCLKGKRFLFTGVEVTEDEFTAAMLGKTE